MVPVVELALLDVECTPPDAYFELHPNETMVSARYRTTTVTRMRRFIASPNANCIIAQRTLRQTLNK